MRVLVDIHLLALLNGFVPEMVLGLEWNPCVNVSHPLSHMHSIYRQTLLISTSYIWSTHTLLQSYLHNSGLHCIYYVCMYVHIRMYYACIYVCTMHVYMYVHIWIPHLSSSITLFGTFHETDVCG